MHRLQPLQAELGPGAKCREVCALAYSRQISLAAYGFYCSPFGGVHRWRKTGAGEHLSSADRSPASNVRRGDIFNYFAFGCSTTEVELDVLTGLFEVIRADILMDVGDSLNAGTQVTCFTGTQVQILTLHTHISHRYRAGGGRVCSGHGPLDLRGDSLQSKGSHDHCLSAHLSDPNCGGLAERLPRHASRRREEPAGSSLIKGRRGATVLPLQLGLLCA